VIKHLFQILKGWLALPAVDDHDEHQFREVILVAANNIILFVAALGLIGTFLGGRTRLGVQLAIFFFILNYGVVRWLKRVKGPAMAGVWLIISGTLMITAAILIMGTIRAPLTAIFVQFVIFAGLMYGLRGILATTAAGSLIVLGAMIAEQSGLLPQPDMTVTVTQWITYTILYGFAGSMTYLAYRLSNQTSARLRKELEGRRSVEADLRKLIRAVEQSPASIVITNLDGTIEYVNPRFTQVTGYSQEEALGQNPRILKTDQTPRETHSQMWETLSSGKEWRGEFINRKKDGTFYYESAVISPITDHDGVVTHFLAVKEDITEDKRMREHLLHQRDLAQALLGTSSVSAALDLCLSFVMKTSGFDCGGILLVNRATGTFEMAVSRGFPESFECGLHTLSPDHPVDVMIRAGMPFYSSYAEALRNNFPVTGGEGLRALVLVPMLYQGEVIACFNLASRAYDALPPVDRVLVEEIALQVGNALVRIQAQEDLQRSHDELTRSELRFRSLFEQTHDAIFILDLAGRHLAANQRAADMLGYTLDELLRLSFKDISVEPEKSAQVRERLLAGEAIPLFERQFRKKNGGLVPVEINLELVRDEHDLPLHIQSMARDISARKLAEAAVRESEAKYRIVADNTYDWEFWQNPEGNYVYISPACKHTCGYEAAELMADPGIPRQLVHPDDLQIVDRHNQVVKDKVHDEMVFRLIHRDGSLRWIGHTCTPIFGENGEYLGVRGSNRDITRRKLAEDALLQTNEQLAQRVQDVERLQAELREQALRDPLTGLYNRRYLTEMLEHLHLWAEREGQPFSFIVADIDHFKSINDTYGHNVGDQFLVKVAQTLKRGMRGMDLASRYGGEEFLLVLPGAAAGAAGKRAEALRQRCMEIVIQHEGKPLSVTLSFGVASYPEHSWDSAQVILKADQALYNSKRGGRNRVSVWEEQPG